MPSPTCPLCDRAFPPPRPPIPAWPPLQDRLTDRIEIGPPPAYRPELGPCWLWTGAQNKDGYGTLNHVRAHRLVWELLVGPIPDGLVRGVLAARAAATSPLPK